jgi:hypothetical protein
MQQGDLVASEVVVGPGVRFSVGSALSRSFAVWKRNLPFLLLVAVLAQLPGFLVSAALPHGGGIFTPGARLQAILDTILGYVSAGVVTVSVLDQLRGRPRDNRRSLSAGASQLGPLIGTAIGTSFLSGLLMFLLVVPGVVALVRWYLVAPIVIIEPGALPRRRSSALISGHGWEIFGVLVVFFVAMLIAAAGFGAAGGALAAMLGVSFDLDKNILLDAITALPGPLFLSFQSVLQVVLYEQLRAEKEGVDVGQLTAVFE